MRSEEELNTVDPEREKTPLTNLTYLIQEKDALNMLEEHLHRILALVEKLVPSDEGLKHEGPSTLLPCKRSKQGEKRVVKRK